MYAFVRKYIIEIKLPIPLMRDKIYFELCDLCHLRYKTYVKQMNNILAFKACQGATF